MLAHGRQQRSTLVALLLALMLALMLALLHAPSGLAAPALAPSGLAAPGLVPSGLGQDRSLLVALLLALCQHQSTLVALLALLQAPSGAAPGLAPSDLAAPGLAP